MSAAVRAASSKKKGWGPLVYTEVMNQRTGKNEEMVRRNGKRGKSGAKTFQSVGTPHCEQNELNADSRCRFEQVGNRSWRPEKATPTGSKGGGWARIVADSSTDQKTIYKLSQRPK